MPSFRSDRCGVNRPLRAPYKNCTEAHKDGAYNIKKGDPGYESRLDRDGDGIACEPKLR
nr:excalibur calcium-binding domain-containing protein [Mycobacteroides abscessus]